MKQAKLTIHGRLSGLNEYTQACRNNRYNGARMKEQNELQVKASIAEQLSGGTAIRFTGKVFIEYAWYEKNKRRDLDNVAFAKKFIQDALVSAGVLDGDGWENIIGFADDFYIDKDNPRIEVTIKGVQK